MCPEAHDQVPVHGVAVLQRESSEVLEEGQRNDKVLTVPHFKGGHGKDLVHPQKLGILWREGKGEGFVNLMWFFFGIFKERLLSPHSRVTQTTTHDFLGGFKCLSVGGDLCIGPPTEEKQGEENKGDVKAALMTALG